MYPIQQEEANPMILRLVHYLDHISKQFVNSLPFFTPPNLIITK